MKARIQQQTPPALLPTAGSPCSAVGYMNRLSYGGFFEEAEKRHAAGDRQIYCENCKLACWPEEQRTCPNFVRSEELERFYAKENAYSRDPGQHNENQKAHETNE